MHMAALRDAFPAPRPAAATLVLLLVLAPKFDCLADYTAALPQMRWMPPWTLAPADIPIVEFALNLEFLEADFFMCAAKGYNIDKEYPTLSMGGPKPIGCKRVDFGPDIKAIITEMAYQEVGHLRAILDTLHGFPRPLLNISAGVFAELMNAAMGFELSPPFNYRKDAVHFLLAAYSVPYPGLNGYCNALPKLMDCRARRLVGGLLQSEAGQDAVFRSILYELRNKKVSGYKYTVAYFTNRISMLRNRLGNPGRILDEGLVVDRSLGAEGKVTGNVFAADEFSTAYPRTPEMILAIVYGSGLASEPGLFFPNGGNGTIALSSLYGGKGWKNNI